jgi:hypothetical protein
MNELWRQRQYVNESPASKANSVHGGRCPGRLLPWRHEP